MVSKLAKKIIFAYECPSCSEIYVKNEKIQYCDSEKCLDKDVKLTFKSSIDGGTELSWSNGEEWGKIFCPMLGKEVMTYWKEGTPCYDTYTNPIVNDDGEIYYYRYDQDEGGWWEDPEWLGLYNGIDTCRFG